MPTPTCPNCQEYPTDPLGWLLYQGTTKFDCSFQPPLPVYLQAGSDFAIAGAYFAIPLAILFFARRRKNWPFRHIQKLFAAFILACGTTHLLTGLAAWHNFININLIACWMTALISWATVITVLPAIRQALTMRTPEELEQEVVTRTHQLEAAKEAIMQSEVYWRTLAEAIPQLVWIDEPTGECIYLSKQWEEYSGIPVAELLGWKWTELIHPDDRGRVLSAWEASTKGDADYDIEYRLRRRDGEYRRFRVRGVPARQENKIVKWFGTCTDVEDQRKAEDVTLASEQHWRHIAESLPVMVWSADDKGRVNFYGGQFADYTGKSEHELLRDGWEVLVHPDDLQHVSDFWQAAIDSRTEFHNLEFRCRRHDGEWRWFRATGVPVNEHGKFVWRGANMDIHDLRVTKSQLIEAGRRKDEFFAMLAHELRNPLAPISNAYQILKGDPPKDVRDRTMALMKRSLDNMVRLVDDLLDISRIARGKMKLRKEPFVVQDVLMRAVDEQRSFAGKQMHALNVDMPPQPITVNADPARIQQVFNNLINNAIKYTKMGGEITVSLDDTNCPVDTACIKVSDNGVGIDPTILPNIFDMFVQSEQSIERSQGGMGIGLAIVKSIITLHGGRVEVESEAGKGTTFSVYLPTSTETVTPPIKDPSGEKPALNLRPYSVLVVDDMVDGAMSMKMVLEQHGATVDTAHDGEEAVVKAKEMKPSVIILDIGLPKKNGFQVCIELRDLPEFDSTPIIAVTGYGQESDVQRASEAGFNHHFTKPVDPTELAAAIQKMLANK